jgi:ABC-2 type transport system permease protein
MRVLARLVVKDWKIILADPRAVVLCFAVPVVLASAFGMIFEGPAGRLGVARLPILVVDEDGSDFSRRVIADLTAGERIDAQECDRATAEERVAARDIGVALVLPAGFGRVAGWEHVSSGERPNVELIHNTLSATEAQWAEGLLTEAVMRRLAGGEWHRPFELERSTVPREANQPFNAYGHSFCGMTVQYLLFWGMETGLLLLREQRRGVWRRTLTAPVSLETVLLAKVLASAGIALAMVLVTFGFGRLAFGVTVAGSAYGFGGMAVAVSLLSAATGLLVAAIGGTEARARSLCVLVILMVSLLGGLWLPSFVLPGWVRSAGHALPTTWAMRGLDGVTWQGMGPREALPCAAAVLGFGLAFLAIAGAGLARSEARRKAGIGS